MSETEIATAFIVTTILVALCIFVTATIYAQLSRIMRLATERIEELNAEVGKLRTRIVLLESDGITEERTVVISAMDTINAQLRYQTALCNTGNGGLRGPFAFAAELLGREAGPRKIPLKTAVTALADHLGVQFKTVSASERVEVVKKPE